MKTSITIEVEITDEIIRDVWDTAAGYINYWADYVRLTKDTVDGAHVYSGDYLAAGFEYKIWDIEEPPMTGQIFNKEMMAKGIALEAQRRNMTVDAWFDNHDAADADNAVQMGLFGEIVYG